MSAMRVETPQSERPANHEGLTLEQQIEFFLRPRDATN